MFYWLSYISAQIYPDSFHISRLHPPYKGADFYLFGYVCPYLSTYTYTLTQNIPTHTRDPANGY